MRTILLTGVGSILLLSFFEPPRKSKLKLPEEFVSIPGGTYTTEPAQTEQGGTTISGFYMSKYEVSNGQYRRFYLETAAGLGADERAMIACDSLGWRKKVPYGGPLADYYYQHPVYTNYPVVNISYEGALKYCAWLQQKIQTNNPAYTIKVSLPEKAQQVWAAQGRRKQAMFPWGNFYLRNNRGEFLCNFNRVGEQSIHRNPQTGKPEVGEPDASMLYRALFTANVKSYFPNDYGLYNMCGNVAEMISEKGICMGGSWNDYGGDVHIRSEARYEGSAPTVGFRPVIRVEPLSQ